MPVVLAPEPVLTEVPCLWLARIDALLPQGTSAWLDGTERERLRKTSHAVTRQSRTAAWILRRWALTGARPDTAPEDWRFTAGLHGKPELAPEFARFGLHHNLSHGGAYAAVLVDHAPCGVDVEPEPDGIEAAAVTFGARARAAIVTHPRPTEGFLQHWVFKEALLKLVGTGLMTPEAWEVVVAPDGCSATPAGPSVDDPTLPPTVVLRSWPLPGGHRLAAALSRPGDLQPTWAPWSSP